MFGWHINNKISNYLYITLDVLNAIVNSECGNNFVVANESSLYLYSNLNLTNNAAGSMSHLCISWDKQSSRDLFLSSFRKILNRYERNSHRECDFTLQTSSYSYNIKDRPCYETVNGLTRLELSVLEESSGLIFAYNIYMGVVPLLIGFSVNTNGAKFYCQSLEKVLVEYLKLMYVNSRLDFLPFLITSLYVLGCLSNYKMSDISPFVFIIDPIVLPQVFERFNCNINTEIDDINLLKLKDKVYSFVKPIMSCADNGYTKSYWNRHLWKWLDNTVKMNVW